MAQPVQRHDGTAHSDSRRGLMILARRSLLGGAFLAALAWLALRGEAPPLPVTTPALAIRDEARLAPATVARTQERARADRVAKAGRDIQAEVARQAERQRRATVVAPASNVSAADASPSSAPSPIATPARSAAERTYAQAMAQYIDSPEFAEASGPLARLYFASFNRFPDEEGLDYYVAQRAGGRSLESIADEFMGSPEFQSRYGELDNAAFIARVFDNVFGVAPDAAQRAYWLDLLDSGLRRGQLIIAFSEGADFRNITSNEVFVATAYAEALGRTPDVAGFAYWVDFLDAGNPRQAVIEGLLATGALRTAGRTPPRGG